MPVTEGLVPVAGTVTVTTLGPLVEKYTINAAVPVDVDTDVEPAMEGVAEIPAVIVPVNGLVSSPLNVAVTVKSKFAQGEAMLG